MNYADFGLGTWQPTNGFYDVVNAMISIGKDLGVKYHNNSTIDKIITDKNEVSRQKNEIEKKIKN